MRREFLFPVLILLACLAGTPAAAGTAGPQKAPAAVVPNPIHNFAVVVEGQEVRHDFIIRNTGTAPLVVHRVKTG